MAVLFPQYRDSAGYATGGWTGSSTATWTVTNDVWLRWTTTGSTTTTYTMTWQQPIWDAWVEDEAQRDELQARREQQSRERLATAQKRREDKEAADARARELLHSLLSDAERTALTELQYLQIEGSDGRLYRLETHRNTVHGNIVRVDEHGCVLGRACVAPSMYDDVGSRVLPTEDGWVGQYLGLRFDAREFLSHANWSGTRPCQVPQQVAA